MQEQEKFMKEALKEAKKAYKKLEVPIGAVIVKDNQIIARGHNLKEKKQCTLKHAELMAIEKASKKINNYPINLEKAIQFDGKMAVRSVEKPENRDIFYK